MTRFYFHCTGSDWVLVDDSGTELPDLVDAHARALGIARRVMSTAAGGDDCREWLVHVSDEEGWEMFVVPFAEVIGRLH